ncbi:MAG: TldD/PmbA family protein [Firmicutes bacterium]|nr:TldD/PmbA family protein [Bacillota bacterium]
MKIREFKERVFAAGAKAGLKDMEIYVSRSQISTVRVFESEIDDYSVSDAGGVGFRARYGGKVGYSYVEALDEASVELLTSGAKANAQIIDSDDEVFFFGGSPSYPEVEAFNTKLKDVSTEERIEYAKKLEAAALEADSRVSMVNYAVTGVSEEEVYLANTKGLERSFVKNGAYSFVAAVIRDGEEVRTGGKLIFSNDWGKFDAEKQAREAVAEGVSLLKAQTVNSGNYRTLFRYDVAREILQTFASVFSAQQVQRGLSLLEGKLGRKIAVPQLTLVDDPLMPHGGASMPFDGEGVAAKTKNVIEQGHLKTFLHNLKTAKKDGLESTGNAHRFSFKSPIGIAPANFYIKPGGRSYTDLIADLDNGLIIIDVQGLHSGADPVSGDFSLGAYGYLVEKGRIARPVDQITVAGNFFELLETVEEIGSDLEFGAPGYGGQIGSPSLLVENMAIAGS